MVAWYKHDIPAWMDATEGLDDGPYRAFHTICQLIYLNEGPIRHNEHGISGRCKQHILAFRKNLNLLVTQGKLVINPDGTIDQPRANLELRKIDQNRVNAGKGGSSPRKPLKKQPPSEATLQQDGSLKTRLDETRLEKKDADHAVARAREPEPPDNPVPEHPPEPPPSIGGLIPRGWLPGPDDIAVAIEAGMVEGEIEQQRRAFIADRTQREVFSSDWSGSWGAWCRQWAKAQPKKAPPRVVVDRKPPAPPAPKKLISEAAFELSAVLIEAMGLSKDDPAAYGSPSIVQSWLSQELHPDLILQTVREGMARRRAKDPPKSLRYFERAIAEAHAEFKRQVPEVKTIERETIHVERPAAGSRAGGSILDAIGRARAQIRDRLAEGRADSAVPGTAIQIVPE